jgi:hypothetical protein
MFMLYIVVDHFLMAAPERIEADSDLEAIRKAALLLGVDKCVSQNMILAAENPVGNKYVDEVSHMGWGKECKYEGKPPDHQVIFWLITLDELAHDARLRIEA